MKPVPSVSDHESAPIVTFESIPFWEGLQSSPGVSRTSQFSVIAEINQPIRQFHTKQAINNVVEAYQSDEYQFITPPPGASAWANSLGERSIRAVNQLVGDTYPKNILEIGGGSTWIAQRLQESYHSDSYVLVDPSVRDSAKEVEVIRDYFPNQKLVDRHFDLILGFSVLEHVPDPLHFLCSIRKQLTTNGKVVLIYPDCESQLRQGDLNSLLHEHLSYFTEASSRWLASASGFKVISLSSKNDTFTLALELCAGESVTNNSLDESELLLQSAEMFQNLQVVTGRKIRSYLEDGKKVAFHGATNGLNTFFFLTGLGEEPNIRLYDGDESKEGLYLPASSIPIISPRDPSYSDNSLLIVSANSFFEQIKQFATEKAGFDSTQLLPLLGAS